MQRRLLVTLPWITAAAVFVILMFQSEAIAQRVTELAKSNPWQVYLSLQRSVAKDYNTDERKAIVIQKTCDEHFGSVNSDEPLDLLLQLARYFVRLRHELAAYPREVWWEDLHKLERGLVSLAARHEQQAFDDFYSNSTTALTRKLESYRAMDSTLPQVVRERCKAHWISQIVWVRIQPIPDAEQIRIASPNKFEVCVDNNFSPDDVRCDIWTDISGLSKLRPGRYKVYVKWDDGKRTDPPRNMDTEVLARENNARVFVVKKPI